MTGCASLSPDPAFEEVAAVVNERGGLRIHWNQGTEEDARVAAAVDALLSKELTADTAVQIALLNNPSLQATYASLGVAQADLVQAGLMRNPILNTVFRFPESGGPVSWDIGLAFEFLSLFTLPLRKKVAESEFEAARIRVSGAVLDHAAETRTAFYAYQAAMQSLEMMRQVAASTQASHHLSKQLREAGNITDLALAQSRGMAEQARIDLADAEAATMAAREELNIFMGLWGPQTEWKAADRLPELPNAEIDLDRVESRAVERSLDLALARQNLVTLGRQYGLTKATSLVPDFEVGVEGERDDRVWETGPGVSFALPLFDQGQARSTAAKAAISGAQSEYEALAVWVRTQTRAVHRTLLSSRQKAAYYGQVILPLRQRIVAETLLHYNAMQLGTFQLLLAKQQQIDAGRRYIQSLYDYWVARSNLEQILSGRMPPERAGAMAAQFTPQMQAQEGGH
jgi:cobalt-zinc-cadmium efflux system outer membrane protein